jgi:uncharacterized membrane protein YcaP (DUF421 family)
MVMEGVPVLLYDSGEFLHENMKKERVDEDDIRIAARSLHGLETLEGVKYAVLERGGSISIIPHQNPFARGAFRAERASRRRAPRLPPAGTRRRGGGRAQR